MVDCMGRQALMRTKLEHLIDEKKMTKIRVCMVWHDLNSSNYGVSALAISHLDMVIKAANANNTVIEIDFLGYPESPGNNVRQTLEKRYEIKIGHISLSLKGFLKDFLSFRMGWQFNRNKYDYVLDIGGGDSFADIYGLKPFFFIVITKYLAIKAGSKLILSPQTIGPFKRSYTQKIAKYLMKHSERIFVRDFKSKQHLDSLNINATEVSDVAFMLPYEKQPVIEGAVGVNVSGLLWHGGYNQKNQFGLTIDYQVCVKAIIEGLLIRGKQVHLIGHVIDDNFDVEDDYRVLLELKKQYQENSNVIVAPKFNSAIEAKSYISQMTFFTGSRMHATIGAISAGVVTIPIAYSRKFSGVFGSINYKYTLDAFGDTSTEAMISTFFDLYDNQYVQMKDDVETARSNAIMQLANYLDYLKSELK